MGKLGEGRMSEEVDVLEEGRSGCNHSHILYTSSRTLQGWSCDESDCGRRVTAPYAEGNPMLFPAGALIRLPNPLYGGSWIYSFRVDEKGEASELPKSERVRMSDITQKLDSSS